VIGRAAIVVLGLVACGGGGDHAPAPARAAALGGELRDPGAGSGDVIVATVDGRPVWGSCVAGHVRARGVSVDQALTDCIELELLAAAAVARGVADRVDTRRELVSALVDGYVGEAFEDTYTSAAALPPSIVEQAVQSNAYQLDRPEERTVVYARAKFAEDNKAPAPPVGSPTDLAAKAFAEEIYAGVRGQTDLFPEDLFAAARAVAGDRRYHLGDRPFTAPRHGVAVEEFSAAMFEIPAIGQVSPPTRTPWGWDVILLVDVHPPVKRTRDELVAEMFPGMRRAFFDQVWVRGQMKRHAIEEHPELLEEPEEAEEPEAPEAAPGAVP
jgi:hypothetical protein